jgi:Fusaric acid resistance protein-like
LTAAWLRDLYRINTPTGVRDVFVRMFVAVGVPLLGGALAGHIQAGVAGGATALFVTMSDIGTTVRVRLGTMLAGWCAILAGGTLAHLLGQTPYARETVVLVCALVAGWASGSYPGIAAVTRFFAIAAAAGVGMRFTDPDVLLGVLAGGTSAFAGAYLAWHVFGTPAGENLIDWREGVRRAFAGSDAGVAFTLSYGAAAATALFAANALGVKESFWATLVVLMVMRREGVASLELTIHYALGTIAGVIAGGLLLQIVHQPLTLALLAICVIAPVRIGFAVNPSLGYMSFTMFLLLVTCATESRTHALMPHLLQTRIYDVTVGCLLALAGTVAATWSTRRSLTV